MPNWFWAALFFVYGAVVGSFLNVCIWRMPREESVMHPPSHCPGCNRRLAAVDLVPLLSQVLLRARCRYCGVKISWRYFWVEMLTALAFTALYLRYGLEGRWVEAIAACLFTATLIVIFFIDLEHYIIPDIAVYIGVAVGVGKDLWLIHEGSRQLWRTVPFTNWIVPIPQSIIGLAVGSLGLLLIAKLASLAFRKEAMGMGDVFLLAAMGANLSIPCMLLAFFIAVFIGSGVGVVLMALRLKGRRDEVPFGPMLVLGTFLAMLFGESMIRLYLHSLGMADVVPPACWSLGLGQ
jgi:leader peptidase (prepilin peptidase)/N-methyltransferase